MVKNSIKTIITKLAKGEPMKVVKPSAVKGLGPNLGPNNGFSLIEVLLAMVILAVGLLAVAQLQVHAIRGLGFARHLSIATQLAGQQLEFLRSLPYNDDDHDAIPKTVAGVNIVDASGRSVLLDNSGIPNDTDGMNYGDGNVSADWHVHADNPLNEFGKSQATNGGWPFYVRWKIERGGKKGTSPVAGADVGVPGAGQMLIKVQVLWWENGYVTPGLTGKLRSATYPYSSFRPTGSHRVRLQTLRQHKI